MYQLNVESTEFTHRTKSVFDTLMNIETCHKTKTVEFEEYEGEEDIEEPNSVSEITSSLNLLNNPKEHVFKMPKPIKRSIEVCTDNVAANVRPDYAKNPHKWQKYTLADVKEGQMSANANYAAAMSFLNAQKNALMETNEEEVDQTPIEFNRPIGGKRNQLVEAADSEHVDTAELEEKTISETENTFKKKSVRKNLRKKDSSDEKEENDCWIWLNDYNLLSSVEANVYKFNL